MPGLAGGLMHLREIHFLRDVNDLGIVLNGLGGEHGDGD